MPRLTSPNGTVVDVSDETAELLGAGYTPVEEKKAPAKKAAAKKSTAKADDK